MPIYTRFGDGGETRLFDGSRVGKNDPRVSAYGGIDELNSLVGLVRTFLSDAPIDTLLVTIQQQLMGIGASLANPAARRQPDRAQPAPSWVRGLEAAIDTYEEELPRLQRFILPGGGAAGAHLHLARTVCRRAERQVADLSGQARVEPVVLEYINRLSDLLFVLARVANYREGTEEILW